MARLDGKVAVVTAASSAVGRTTALTLAREGALVVAADPDGLKAEAVAQAVAANGGTATGHRADASRPGDVEALLAAAVGAYGGLHVMCNNPPDLTPTGAAGSDPGTHTGPDADTTVVDLDLDACERALRLHLRATM